METVTLHAEDFRTVHNTLCELRDIEQRLNTVLSADMVDRLHGVIKGFEQGLRSAYEQDEAQFDSKMDYYSEFQRENGLRSVWSIYELPVHGFTQDHPYTGALQVAYGEHWGDDPVFEEIKGRTWADLYRAADRAIARSGDGHHVFIEAFTVNPSCPEQLILHTGS